MCMFGGRERCYLYTEDGMKGIILIWFMNFDFNTKRSLLNLGGKCLF